MISYRPYFWQLMEDWRLRNDDPIYLQTFEEFANGASLSDIAVLCMDFCYTYEDLETLRLEFNDLIELLDEDLFSYPEGMFSDFSKEAVSKYRDDNDFWDKITGNIIKSGYRSRVVRFVLKMRENMDDSYLPFFIGIFSGTLNKNLNNSKGKQ
jgi:hypothetical protein